MKIRLLPCIITLTLLLGTVGCKAPAISEPQPISAPKTDITITIDGPTDSTIRPLLGVNAGPVPAGTDPGNPDVTAAYKQSGINMIRTHDYYGALDMSVMYRDRTRDPARPESYNLTESDHVWRTITNGGFEPYFRLGDSWNNATPPANARERINWTSAAIEVLKHYRTGKWGGFNTNFRYVEIWNEPDNQQFWQKPHTPLEYFQLYVETASTIKREFPELNVGGPGVMAASALTTHGRKWMQDFMGFVRQENAPLDFFSWHIYSNIPQQYSEAARFYRASLDANGFTQTPTHITEWNTDIRRDPENSLESLALRTGSKGAAILSAAWIELQNQNDVEVSNFYRGTDPDIRAPAFCGIFYADGRPKHIALAFSLWSKMTLYPQQMEANISPDTPLWMLAGQNNAGKVAILIANPGDTTVTAGIAFADMRKINQISLYKVSDASNQIQTTSLNSPIFEISAYTVQLLLIN